jgi:hypothetical protein
LFGDFCDWKTNNYRQVLFVIGVNFSETAQQMIGTVVFDATTQSKPKLEPMNIDMQAPTAEGRGKTQKVRPGSRRGYTQLQAGRSITSSWYELTTQIELSQAVKESIAMTVVIAVLMMVAAAPGVGLS